MPISEYNTSAASNTVLGTIPIGPGMERNKVNDAIQQLMADIAGAKLLEGTVNPQQYGAVGDGVANDATALASAIAAAQSTGKTLDLGTASYLCTTWTPIVTTATLRIIGNGATVRGPASTVLFLSPTTNFDIDGVTFDRWSGIVSRVLAESGSFTDVRFTNNRVTNVTGIPINIEKPVSDYTITGNRFFNNTGGYQVRIGENTFANQDTYTRGIISHNFFTSISATGTASCAAILAYGRFADVSHNTIEGMTQTGTGECWGIYTKVRYGRIIGNLVRSVLASGNPDNVGINIKGTTRAVTSSPQGFAVVCTGNIVRNVGVAGTSGAGIRAQTDDVLVYGNFIEDGGVFGMVADEASAYSNVRFLGNEVYFSSLVAGTNGFRIEGSGTNVGAENNTVVNATGGCFLNAATADLVDSYCKNNTFTGCTFPVIIDAASTRTLSRAVIDGNVMRSGTAAILNNGSAGTVSQLRLRNNDMSRCGTAVTGSLGTTPEISGNIGYLRGSAVFDPANLVDGAGVTTTVTVSGAVVGDMTRASFSLDLQGILLTSWVSAANTVSVRFQNETGGAIDLASGTIVAEAVRVIA